jgi:DNA-binding response OmpR family regulator/GGDEF domain-containing protein
VAKGRVLAVDDQRYFRELVEEMLAEAGYEARTASTGEEALRLLEQADFDVVLTDLVMPGLDGIELVRRIKERDPEQDVVVVTGVVDVKTAVEAMKLGATDYLLKPFDGGTLAAALEAVLGQRRLRSEHARLLAENIEYLGERSLFERAIALFSSLNLGPLCERIVEALCLETEAQGGVIWVQAEGEPSRLALAAARGLVRVDAEPESLTAADLPPGLAERGLRSLVENWGQRGAGARQGLFLPLRSEGVLVGVVRLSDKEGGGEFDPVDRSCAEKVARFAEMALAAALRIRTLEARSCSDPEAPGGARAYFEDAARKELEQARRAGGSVSLLALEVGSLERLRQELGEAAERRFRAGLAEELRQQLRTGDLVAADPQGQLLALLRASDALGAAVLKQRARAALPAGPLFRDLPPDARPELRIAAATWPADGTRLEALLARLAERLEEERRSPVRVLGLDRLGFAECLAALLDESDTELPRTAEQILRFALAEVRRRPRDAGLLYVAPGRALAGVLRDAVETLREVAARTEITVLCGEAAPSELGPAISWQRPPPGRPLPPFLLRFGDAPAYALVRAEKEGADGARFFHSADRGLVEHLLFQLRREIGAGLPGGA